MIWVFGDSFAEQYSNLKDQWMQVIADNLNQELKCFGLSATSADYTYQKFNNIRDDIKHNDIIIICLTSINRRWFFKDYPQSTTNPENQSDIVDLPHDADDVKLALQLYNKYLNHNEIYETYLYNFLYNLDYISKQLNLHTIVLINFWDTESILKNRKESFPHINFAIGTMQSVNIEELTKQYITNIDLTTKDKRVNHLTKTNQIGRAHV